MGTWTTAVSDLRTLLNDNSADRYFYRKECFGTADGTNMSFKTFEFRRVTDFSDPSSAVAPLGVYVNGVIVDPTTIESDNTETGEFVFTAAPAAQATIEATYYTQQFFDSELQDFLIRATGWLQLGSDFTQIPNVLWDAALNYCAGQALVKLAMRWAMRASDTFRLNDAPKKEAMGIAETYQNLAKVMTKTAVDSLKISYQDRGGQALAPNFATIWGQVSAITPRR